jgi:hypothetical protein
MAVDAEVTLVGDQALLLSDELMSQTGAEPAVWAP